MAEDFTERLVRHCLSIDWQEMPDASRETTCGLLMDSLAVGIAGTREPGAQSVLAAARQWSGDGGTSLLLGRPGEFLPAPYAAMVNAYQIHCQEFDCVHEEAVAHPMATLLAALLAEVGRGEPITAIRFLEACTAGIEAIATIGLAAPGSLTFFRPSTAGIFGSVIGLCRLRQLDVGPARLALGHALTFASGTMQAHREGKPTLALQAGAAARSAVQALDLTRAGFAAPHDPLEGQFGYFALFESETALEYAAAGMGHGLRIDEVSWKPFPTGRAAHGGIVAVQRLMAEHLVSHQTLERLVITAPPLIARLVGRRPAPDMSINQARLCLPWLAALTLHRGTVTLDDFTDPRIADHLIHETANRITVEPDGSDNWSSFTPLRATAWLTDGTQVSLEVTRQLGSPAEPLSRQQRQYKIAQCLEFAQRAEWIDPMTEFSGALEQAEDLHHSLGRLFATSPGNG